MNGSLGSLSQGLKVGSTRREGEERVGPEKSGISSIALGRHKGDGSNPIHEEAGNET